MINDLKAGLNLARGVVDLAKGLKELSGNTDNLEIREAAAELHSQTIDLKEIVNEMREEIFRLKEKIAFKETLDFNGKTFEYVKNDKTIFICNGCAHEEKYTHMTEYKHDNGDHMVVCPVCKHKVQFSSAPIKKHKTAGRRNPYTNSSEW